MTDERNIDEELPDALRDAVDALRDPVPVRSEWRNATLSLIGPRQRVWSVRPAMAIAASVALVVIGAAGGALIVARERDDQPAAAAAGRSNVVRFVYVQPSARHVSVVGDFNGWNPTAMPLQRLSDGSTWIVELTLPAGQYTYAFVVDGKIVSDPTAARATGDDFGVPSSVVSVRGS